MTPTLERILAEVKTLSSGEKMQLRELLAAQQPVDLAERQALIRETMGKYAHLLGSSEEFMARKQEDLDLEEQRRWERSRASSGEFRSPTALPSRWHNR